MDLNDTNFFMLMFLGDVLMKSCYPEPEEEPDE